MNGVQIMKRRTEHGGHNCGRRQVKTGTGGLNCTWKNSTFLTWPCMFMLPNKPSLRTRKTGD